jgi:hypothetical protein
MEEKRNMITPWISSKGCVMVQTKTIKLQKCNLTF